MTLEEKTPTAYAVIQKGIEKGLHLGAQVYVSLNGECVVDDAVGINDTDASSSLDTDTLVLWMSASKPIAAVAIAQLWEQDELDLDAPVMEVIEEFGAWGKGPITTRHILTHTCGFREADIGEPGLSWEEYIERTCDTPLEEGWVIGETAGYHMGTSWFILGELVRRIDGRNYSDYVRECIFEPLGMGASSVGMTEAQYAERSSRIGITYMTDKGFAERLTQHEREFCLSCKPGGNGRGPIRELGRFYEMLLNGGEGNGARVLKPETVAEFTRPHRVGQFDETFRHKMDWSLGFIVDSNRYGIQTVPYGYGKHCSSRTFGHGGYQSTSGFADPEQGLVVAVAFNGLAGEPKHTKRIRDFATAVYEDLGLSADGENA